MRWTEAEAAGWLGEDGDATLLSYLLSAETPATAIRAALAGEPGPAPGAEEAARRDALLAAGREAVGDADGDDGPPGGPLSVALAGLTSPAPRFRALAAWALGRLARPAAVRALGVALADEPDPVARQAALRALGAAGLAAAGLAGLVGAIAADPDEPEALRALARRVATRLGPVAEAPATPERSAPLREPAAAWHAEAARRTDAIEPPGLADLPASAPPSAPVHSQAPPTSDEPAAPPAASDDLDDDQAATPAGPAGPRLAYGRGEAAAPAATDGQMPGRAEPEPPPDDPLLAALVALRPGLAGAPLRARVVHALALQGFAIEADVLISDRGDGRPGAVDLLATRGDETLALVLADELPTYAALLALGQVTARARGVVIGVPGLTQVPEFADWLVAGGRWRLRG